MDWSLSGMTRIFVAIMATMNFYAAIVILTELKVFGCSQGTALKFGTMSKATFYLRLKACECRFNNQHQSVYDFLLKINPREFSALVVTIFLRCYAINFNQHRWIRQLMDNDSRACRLLFEVKKIAIEYIHLR